MTQFAAVERTIAALDGLGRLEEVDAALVEVCRGLAAAVDDKPDSPGLWREYREAVKELAGGDDGGGGVDELLAELRAPVRDAAES